MTLSYDLKAFISSLELSNGLRLELSNDSIVVFLGPNNSGKSTALSNIVSAINSHSEMAPGLVVASVDVERSQPFAEVYAVAKRHAGPDELVRMGGNSFYLSNVHNWWNATGGALGALGTFLVSYLPTRQRLNDCEPPQSIDLTKQEPSHPIQLMYRDHTYELAVSALFRKAFAEDLVLHRAAGQVVPLYVGARPILAPGEDPTHLSYVKRLEELKPLSTQGDGMVSFASLVIRLKVEGRAIQIVDEPEAFLHPPQARLIGQILSSDDVGKQLFVATHNSDVIRGLLAGATTRLTLVRLQRSQAKFKAKALSADEVARLWKDPILRYSNVLEGLFHGGVVVTEGDADCKFYDAITSASIPDNERADAFYTYSGGKHRIPVIVRALKGLAVPVSSVVDFDTLNNERPLRDIVEAHGGSWADYDRDWTSIKATVESSKNYLNAERFAREVTDLLAKVRGDKAVPKDTIRAFRDACTQASPWAEAKKRGIDGLPSGEPQVRARALIERLAAIGIFLIPSGEMEGFCRTIGNHGPRWVEQVLELDLSGSDDLAAARKFVRRINDNLLEQLAVEAQDTEQATDFAGVDPASRGELTSSL